MQSECSRTACELLGNDGLHHLQVSEAIGRSVACKRKVTYFGRCLVDRGHRVMEARPIHVTNRMRLRASCRLASSSSSKKKRPGCLRAASISSSRACICAQGEMKHGSIRVSVWGQNHAERKVWCGMTACEPQPQPPNLELDGLDSDLVVFAYVRLARPQGDSTLPCKPPHLLLRQLLLHLQPPHQAVLGQQRAVLALHKPIVALQQPHM